MEDEEDLRLRLETFKTEHRDLDIVIEQIMQSGPIDQLRLQRLKKRKLVLRDMIIKIQTMLIPDIIA